MINIELSEEEIKELAEAQMITINDQQYIRIDYTIEMIKKYIASLEIRGEIKITQKDD